MQIAIKRNILKYRIGKLRKKINPALEQKRLLPQTAGLPPHIRVAGMLPEEYRLPPAI